MESKGDRKMGTVSKKEIEARISEVINKLEFILDEGADTFDSQVLDEPIVELIKARSEMPIVGYLEKDGE